MTDLPDGFTFTSERSRMDRDAIHAWLSEEAYWALGRPRQTQDAAIDGSLNFGIFDAAGAQVAYARAVTDSATFAWLCDVFVDTSVRGLGIGKALAGGVVRELDALGIGRVLLATSTAQELYRRFGFTALEPPENWMIKVRDGQFMPGAG
jgi:GNAT superfamily N-acetyltransferase